MCFHSNPMPTAASFSVDGYRRCATTLTTHNCSRGLFCLRSVTFTSAVQMPLRAGIGWGGRIRTYEWRDQNPLPYHLATPQNSIVFSQIVWPNRSISRSAGDPLSVPKKRAGIVCGHPASVKRSYSPLMTPSRLPWANSRQEPAHGAQPVALSVALPLAL